MTSTEQKNYDLSLKTRGSKSDTETRVEIQLDFNTTLGDIMKFTTQAKELFKKAMTASKRGDYIDFQVCTSVYKYIDNTLKQQSFNFWSFQGYNEDAEGIYLSPDTRYTPENHDLYLTKDILKDLSNV